MNTKVKERVASRQIMIRAWTGLLKHKIASQVIYNFASPQGWVKAYNCKFKRDYNT